MKILSLTIPLNPIPKKNSNRIARAGNGRSYVIPSNEAYEYQRQCGFFLSRYTGQCGFPISMPVEVVYKFYRKDARRCDMTNLEEAMDDILVHYGILKDDNYKIVASHDGTRVRIDREHPRTEITIRSFEDETD